MIFKDFPSQKPLAELSAVWHFVIGIPSITEVDHTLIYEDAIDVDLPYCESKSYVVSRSIHAVTQSEVSCQPYVNSGGLISNMTALRT